jgi:hypothetical protein
MQARGGDWHRPRTGWGGREPTTCRRLGPPPVRAPGPGGESRSLPYQEHCRARNVHSATPGRSTLLHLRHRVAWGRRPIWPLPDSSKSRPPARDHASREVDEASETGAAWPSGLRVRGSGFSIESTTPPHGSPTHPSHASRLVTWLPSFPALLRRRGDATTAAAALPMAASVSHSPRRRHRTR